MARCCDAPFLWAEIDVTMKTVISSHVKDKNCVFTGYQIFVTGKVLVFHRCLYNNKFWIAGYMKGPSTLNFGLVVF